MKGHHQSSIARFTPCLLAIGFLALSTPPGQANPFGSIGGTISNGWNNARKGTSNAINRGSNSVKKGINSAGKTVNGWTDKGARATQKGFQDFGKSARGAGNSINRELNRGFQSGSRGISGMTKKMGNLGTQGFNSARGALGNPGRALGNPRINIPNPAGGLQQFGRQQFGNGGLGNQNFRNFQPRVPDFSRQAEHWGNSTKGGLRQLQQGIGRAGDSGRRFTDNIRNQPGVRGTQEAIRRGTNTGVMVEKVRRAAGSEGGSSGGSRSMVPGLPGLPGAITNFPKNVVNAPTGAVKITKQITKPVVTAGKNFEKDVREFGGDVAETSKRKGGDFADASKKIGGDLARDAKTGGAVAARTTEEIFAGGGQILSEGLEQGANAAEDFGRNTGTILADGAEGITVIAAQGEELYRKGEQVYEDGKAFYEEAEAAYEDGKAAFDQAEKDIRAAYEEGKKNYNEAKDVYDTLRKGDREDILEMVEDKTGLTVEGEAKRVLLETDLVDAVELAEDATGIDMENAKQRVAQAQAIGDAARTGTLMEMEEAAGAKTNRDEIRPEKEAGWDGTAWGNEIDHETYAEITGAAVASVAAGNSGPFMAYAENWAAEQYKTLSENLIREGKAELAKQLNKQMLVDALQGAMNGQPVELPIKGVKIDVGMATYNHSLEASAGIPEVTSRGIEINQKSAKTSLPNTHQPYVRFKFEG